MDSSSCENQLNYSCNICSEQFHLELELKQHSLIHMKSYSDFSVQSENESGLKCQVCKTNFPSLSDLKIHNLQFHIKTEQCKSSIENEVCDNLFGLQDRQPTLEEYSVAGTLLPQTDAEQHLKSHDEEKIVKTEISNESFNLDSSSKTHSDCSSDKKTYICEHCEEIFDCFSDFELHVKDNPQETTFISVAEPNTETFALESSSRSQSPVESEQKPYKCDQCDAVFDNLSAFELHVKVHTQEAVNTSGTCSTNFKSSSEVQIHPFQTNRPTEVNTSGKSDACSDTRTIVENNSGAELNKNVRNSEPNPNTTHNDRWRVGSYTCHICNKSFKIKAYLKNHLKTHSGNKPFVCKICGKAFSMKGNLKEHSVSHTGVKTHKCEICDKSYLHRSHLTRHRLEHNGEKPYVCNICNKAFGYKHTLEYHRAVHSKEKPFKCEMCEKTFSREKNLKSHMATHNEGFKCNGCDKSFSSNSDFKHHICNPTEGKPQLNTNYVPFSCAVCKRPFGYKKLLLQHLRVHAKEKLFKCDVCNKSFRFKQSLIYHTRYHTGENLFKCEICNKEFVRNSQLKYHKHIHDEENYHKCEKCEKTFAQKAALQKHMLTHEELRPYTCEICKSSFKALYHLQRHMKTHSDKTFPCEICNKTFKSNALLQYHMVSHNTEKAYSCEKCKKSFRFKNGFSRHVVNCKK